MKIQMILLSMFLTQSALAQFHEKVVRVTGYRHDQFRTISYYEYAITFTKDDWKTQEVILDYQPMLEYGLVLNVNWKRELNYTIKDNYIPKSFPDKHDAILLAEKLSSYEKCKAYNEKLRVSVAKQQNLNSSEIKIY